MTEQEWLDCLDPRPMVKFVVDKASERKLRLFALAACVAGWQGVGKKHRLMYAATEAFVEGTASAAKVRKYWGGRSGLSWPERAADWARGLAQTRSTVQKERRATLARCIFGNPFRRMTPDPASLSPTVQALALAAYEDRLPRSTELDPTRLAILADALEEAGCTDTHLLDHLRSPGPHVRGCWPVDLVLGRR
jgi:hypothetical protein